MGIRNKSIQDGSGIKFAGSHFVAWSHIQDDNAYTSSPINITGLDVGDEITFTDFFMRVPTDLTVTPAIAAGSGVVTIDVTFLDQFGERRVQTITPSGTSRRRTSACCSKIESMVITDISGTAPLAGTNTLDFGHGPANTRIATPMKGLPQGAINAVVNATDGTEYTFTALPDDNAIQLAEAITVAGTGDTAVPISVYLDPEANAEF